MDGATKYHPEVRLKIFLELIFLYICSFRRKRKNHKNDCSIIKGLIRECQAVKNAIKLSRQLGRALYNYVQNIKTKTGVL